MGHITWVTWVLGVGAKDLRNGAKWRARNRRQGAATITKRESSDAVKMDLTLALRGWKWLQKKGRVGVQRR